MVMGLSRRCLRNVSVDRILTSAAIMILVWIFVSRQDPRQEIVQQDDAPNTKAASVKSTFPPMSKSVTSVRQRAKGSKLKRFRTTTPAAEVFMAPTETSAESREIKTYLKAEETKCFNRTRRLLKRNKRRNAVAHNDESDTATEWCPCLPPDLHGRVLVCKTDNMPWKAIGEAVGSDLLVGGEWKPGHCRSHTRLAIIIPCRDRDSHLRVLLKHLIPILKRQLIHFRIFVIDQGHPTIFNKAAIMNVGFLEAEKRFHFDCIVFHDVDHLMEDDRALIRCGPQPHHYAAAVDAWDYRLLYGGLFGGVLTLTPRMFRKVNGFSNIYFGWGGEDDDMGYRIRRYWRVFRPPLSLCRFTTLRHMRDSGNPTNWRRRDLIAEENEKYSNTSKIDNGLTTLKYRITNTKTKQLFTWIEASINETFLPYPRVDHAGLYQRMAGLCRLEDSILDTSDMSPTSCRYQCDTIRYMPCFGYSYQHEKSPHCSILRSACPLESEDGAITYVKL